MKNLQPDVFLQCPEKIVEDDFLLDDAAVDIMPYTFSGDHRQDD